MQETMQAKVNSNVRQSLNSKQKEDVKSLQVMGIPVSKGSKKNNNPLSGESSVRDQRGLKSKNLRETKEQKEKQEAEYKQQLEGLSIVGTSANTKK
jgi:hypothetical protein